LRFLAILILAISLLSTLCSPALASKVNVSVVGQQVQATFALSLVQNVTSLPNISTTIDSTPDSNASAAFAQSFKNVDPSASPSNLTVGVETTNKGLNLTCTFDVTGVSQVNGDIMSVNMTWLPFDVSSDLRAQNFSFNTIGNRYFRSVVTHYANASRFVGLPNSTITGVTFYVNGTSVGPPAAEDYVGNFTTLNFAALTPDLSAWERNYTVSNNTTTWRYFPSQALDFDMRIERKNMTTDYVGSYAYNATISVPGVGRAQGTTILVDIGNGQVEWVMAAAVILAIVSAATVQFQYRNKKKRIAKFQRK